MQGCAAVSHMCKKLFQQSCAVPLSHQGNLIKHGQSYLLHNIYYIYIYHISIISIAKYLLQKYLQHGCQHKQGARLYPGRLRSFVLTNYKSDAEKEVNQN